MKMTYKDKVIQVMSNSRYMTNVDICIWIDLVFKSKVQNNTVCRILHELKKDGMVESRRVKETAYCEYVLIKKEEIQNENR